MNGLASSMGIHESGKHQSHISITLVSAVLVPLSNFESKYKLPASMTTPI